MSNQIQVQPGQDHRPIRGMEIAAVCRIDKVGNVWKVPSQSGNGRYTVHVDQNPRCTCADFENRGKPCKHIFAVEIVMKREVETVGDSIVSETQTVTMKVTQKTYSQDWPAYNAAQVNEQDQFRRLLADLCDGVQTPPQAGRGQRRIPLSDAVFSTVFKVYSTFSGRRFMSDLRAAHAEGLISKLPHYNSIFNYLENPELTPILAALIVESSKPLAAIESEFAADSSGFATSRFVRWFDHKYGVVKQEHDWVKVHIMCGVKTNVVTAVEIKDRNASDPVQLPALLETTAQNFTMKEVSCDKGYSSLNNTNEIAKHGATPFIMFKSNANGNGSKRHSCKLDRSMWQKMFHFFSFKQDEFMTRYHKRSNVESTFSMIKAKFGDAVRSKTDVAMRNEALCKVLAHNICCLISAFYELGIDANFGN